MGTPHEESMPMGAPDQESVSMGTPGQESTSMGTPGDRPHDGLHIKPTWPGVAFMVWEANLKFSEPRRPSWHRY